LNGRVRAVSGHVDAPIHGAWELAACAPNAVDDPTALDAAGLTWTGTATPTTAAAALRAAEQWSLDGAARRFDADDWWWRVRFAGDMAGPSEPRDELSLCVDGIATLADVWLNGECVLESDNMFVGHEKRIQLADQNELVIRCRSVDAALKGKRPRPRWRAPMIENQQLRWFRTTLLGRTPGWSPPAAAVGPWRPVRLARRRGLAIEDVSVHARIEEGHGILEVSARVRDLHRAKAFADAVEIVITRDGREHRAVAARRPHSDDDLVEGRVIVPQVERWWPHTHGEAALYAVRLEAGSVVVDLGNVGFREIAVDTANEGFAIRVNDAPIFCRGACWTPLDPVALAADARAVRTALEQVAAAGMNMVRVSGTMVYEDEAFFDAADAAGILVWQDLMFANMDYPEDDASFVASATLETRQQLRRLGGRPSVAVVCGNSEGEQQAAMFGAGRDRWSPALFHDKLARLAAEMLPDAAYWPSSAHGGAFPHQADRGTTSYYGVGAYLRGLEDARHAEVRFATECLAFANVPAASTLALMPGGESSRVHHPTWKARVPRDLGAGWDFDDVRDHYLARLFRVDAAALRYSDHERYLALGRVVTGEVMAQVFGEWRRARSTCAGGLIWFLRDLWAGAGWGVIGADGIPKAAYHYLRRALAPVALHLSDEGGNGLYVHAFNDGADALEAELTVELYRGETPVGNARSVVNVPARGGAEVVALSLFDGFMDLNHAYRFGPAMCDLVVATLRSATDVVEAFHFPLGLPSHRGNPGVTAKALRREDGDIDLQLATRGFAQSIAFDAATYAADDNFFHLAPGGSRTLRLRRPEGASAAGAMRVNLQPLNAESAISVSIIT
jgi:beta-mannosidase